MCFFLLGKIGQGHGRSHGFGRSTWHQSGHYHGTQCPWWFPQDFGEMFFALDWKVGHWFDHYWKGKFKFNYIKTKNNLKSFAGRLYRPKECGTYSHRSGWRLHCRRHYCLHRSQVYRLSQFKENVPNWRIICAFSLKQWSLDFFIFLISPHHVE